jgi:hypothetical protein
MFYPGKQLLAAATMDSQPHHLLGSQPNQSEICKSLGA